MLVNVCLGLNMHCCIVIIVSEKMEETNNCIHLYTKKYDSINIVFTIVNRCHRCTNHQFIVSCTESTVLSSHIPGSIMDCVDRHP